MFLKNVSTSRKAQAAMEFLMTYGWAILVMLAAISALAYFGVLSPDKNMPETCTMPSGIACLGFSYNEGDIQVSLQNSLGFDMENVIVGISSKDCEASDASIPKLKNYENAIFKLPCALESGRFQGELYVSYVNHETDMKHNKTGRLLMKIQ